MKNKDYKITSGGSLGLLAFGDIGLREWRKQKKVEREAEKKRDEKK